MTLRVPASLLASLALFTCSDLSAIINYGRDNDGNVSDPGSGVPWGNVSRLTDSGGTQIGSSAVYLGDRYMLTADHVQERSYVTFDGQSFWEVEAGSFQQVAPNLDLKVFRLVEDPGLPELMLYEDSLAAEDLSEGATLVGWGVGRADGEPVGTNSVVWGDATTRDKRWGTNETLAATSTIPYEGGNYTALATRLTSNAGPDEAAVTLHDSGSAMFQFLDGSWYLSGIATTVSSDGISNFGNGPNGDLNYFARISEYSDDIYAAIPEPSAWALVLTLSALAGATVVDRRRRKRFVRE